jgi:hypothetical protein
MSKQETEPFYRVLLKIKDEFRDLNPKFIKATEEWFEREPLRKAQAQTPVSDLPIIPPPKPKLKKG